jgi:MSHA biogenesis protein MshQ
VTLDTFTSSEVGSITIGGVDPAGSYGATNYLGMSGLHVPILSDVIGRFVPHHFDTEVPSNACGTFSYSGQPFPAKITARNINGETTKNYTGNFAKDVTFSDANGAAGSFNPAPLPSSAFSAGVADKTFLPYSMSFTFTDKLTIPATIKLRTADTDNVTSTTGAEGTTPIRSGRLVLQNAYGPETEAIKMRLLTQYYNGISFISNPEDTCSKYDATALTCADPDTAPTTPSCSDVTATGVDVSNGQYFTLSAPGKTGALLYTLAVDPWLLYEWDFADNDYNENPTGRANFGIYRGTDRIINWREIIR